MQPADLNRRLTELEEHVAELRLAESFRDSRETSDAIKEGLASIERGEGIPLEEAIASIRREFGLSPAGVSIGEHT